MDELEVVRKLRPAVTVPSESRDAARRRLDHAAGEATGERRSIRRKAGALALVAALAALVFVSGTLWPSPARDGSPADSAFALVFEDGSELTAREVTAAIARGKTDELRRRLAEYGITLNVEEKAVHPEADGRFFGWSFHPSDKSQDPEAGSDWYIDESDAGSTLVVSIGRGDEASTLGLSLFEVFPEICDAIVPTDLAVTRANLEALGFEVKWAVLGGNPDDPGYFDGRSIEGTRPKKTPDDGVIYSVLAGKPYGAAFDISPDMDSVLLEVLPARFGGTSSMWRGLGCR